MLPSDYGLSGADQAWERNDCVLLAGTDLNRE
jgi:hypothetical protein